MHEPAKRRALAFLGALAIAAALPACSGDSGPSLSAPEAFARAKAGQLTIVDIRTPAEWRQTGIGQGVIRIDMRSPGFVQQLLAKVGGDKNAPVGLICRTGNRTTQMQKVLQRVGFTNVVNIKEGMAGSAAGPGWIRQGLPLEPCMGR